MDEKEREALRSTERAVAEVLDDLGFMSWDRCVTAASAVLAVLPSREPEGLLTTEGRIANGEFLSRIGAARDTVAPTEEQLKSAVLEALAPHLGDAIQKGWIAADVSEHVLALFPGEGREAVEAAQRERDAQIVKDQRPKLPPRFEIGEQARRREAIVERAALDRAASAIREAGR